MLLLLPSSATAAIAVAVVNADANDREATVRTIDFLFLVVEEEGGNNGLLWLCAMVLEESPFATEVVVVVVVVSVSGAFFAAVLLGFGLTGADVAVSVSVIVSVAAVAEFVVDVVTEDDVEARAALEEEAAAVVFPLLFL